MYKAFFFSIIIKRRKKKICPHLPENNSYFTPLNANSFFFGKGFMVKHSEPPSPFLLFIWGVWVEQDMKDKFHLFNWLQFLESIAAL